MCRGRRIIFILIVDLTPKKLQIMCLGKNVFFYFAKSVALRFPVRISRPCQQVHAAKVPHIFTKVKELYSRKGTNSISVT